MYFLVNRSISSIQKGIQAGHSALEYCYKYKEDQNLWDFIRDDKTWIILDGGTSRYILSDKIKSIIDIGDMESNINSLESNEIQYASFHEPDLNFCLTAIALVVDERVFNKELYPDFNDWIVSTNYLEPFRIIYTSQEEELKVQYLHEKWLELIGGKQNEFLRTFLSQFSLAK